MRRKDLEDGEAHSDQKQRISRNPAGPRIPLWDGFSLLRAYLERLAGRVEEDSAAADQMWRLASTRRIWQCFESRGRDTSRAPCRRLGGSSGRFPLGFYLCIVR
jgi:hypothetical protein